MCLLLVLPYLQDLGERGDGYGEVSPHTDYETFDGLNIETANQVCFSLAIDSHSWN